MIDFHTHILPNIDDGSTSMDETINLILEAKQVGFTGMISTSHYIQGYYEINEVERKKMLLEIEKRVTELTKGKNGTDPKLPRAKMEPTPNCPNLYLASEIYITTEIIKLINDKRASTINNTKYVLFELPMNSKPLFVRDVVYRLIEEGYRPIIAHPERYNYVQENIDYVEELASMGTLFQSNYGSIIGVYGNGAKKAIKQLLKRNLVHFLGTDVHTTNQIYPKIPKILKKLQKIVSESKLQEMTTLNARKVLKDEDI